MKLFKNSVLGAAIVAAFPFLVLATMAYFSPAPTPIAAPDVTAWYAPWTWGNQGTADLVIEAANAMAVVNYQTSTQWTLWALMAAGIGAMLAKVFEIKKLEDPRAAQTADAAMNRLFTSLKDVDEAATMRIAFGARERNAPSQKAAGKPAVKAEALASS
jgi:hypothetical protein